MNTIQPGIQLTQQEIPNMQPPGSPNNPQGGQQPQGGSQSPLGAPPSPQEGAQSNILNMTPQGQALSAMTPPQQGMTQMARGGNVEGYASKGYVHHTSINPHTEVGTRYKISGVGQGLAPINPVDIEDLMGGSIGISPWDLTGSHTVHEVSGHKLINPIQLQAGQNFPRMLKNLKEGRAGASGQKVVEGQQKRIDLANSANIGRGGTGKVITMPSTMAKSSAMFSHMPLEIQLDLLAQSGLHPEQYERLDELVKKQKGFKNFVGFQHPSLWEHVTSGDEIPVKSVGNLRKAMGKALASKEAQQMLNYNMEDALNATTEPDLMNTPPGYAGRIMLEGQPTSLGGPSPFMDPNHTSYTTGHRQKFIGGSHNAPVELYMPESFEAEKQRLIKKNPKLATHTGLRGQTINSLSWTKKPVGYQPINERVVRNIKRFEEGIKAGDIEPNDLAKVLDYFKRKHGGYKKGGKIEASMDTMRYALTKQKKAK
jgi:hypothetical protein